MHSVMLQASTFHEASPEAKITKWENVVLILRLFLGLADSCKNPLTILLGLFVQHKCRRKAMREKDEGRGRKTIAMG